MCPHVDAAIVDAPKTYSVFFNRRHLKQVCYFIAVLLKDIIICLFNMATMLYCAAAVFGPSIYPMELPYLQKVKYFLPVACIIAIFLLIQPAISNLMAQPVISERLKEICRVTGKCALAIVETLFFACISIYFIASACDLFIYSAQLPPNRIILFSPFALTVALIPSAIAFLGFICIELYKLIYPKELNHKNGIDASFEVIINMQSLNEIHCFWKKLRKVITLGFFLCLIFETANTVFWFMFLYDHNQHFFIGHRLIILFFICITLGIIRSIAEFEAFISAKNKNASSSDSQESLESTEKNRLTTPMVSSIVIDASLIGIGCLCMKSELKEKISFFGKVPREIFWGATLIILIFSVCSATYCNYVKFMVDMDEKRSDARKEVNQNKSLMTTTRHFILSVFHGIANILQQLFPTCISIESYLVKHHYVSKQFLNVFWIGVMATAMILAGVTIKNDLRTLNSYEASKHFAKPNESILALESIKTSPD